MYRSALILAVAACLAACRPKPVQPLAHQELKLPAFTGTVGHLDRGDPFLKFIDAHNRETVSLDLAIPRDEFQGGDETEFSFFVVFDDCDNLPKRKKPSQSYCTGVEYNIPHAAGAAPALVEDGAVRRLRGKFRVEHAPGQHQGLMSVNLFPAIPESEAAR